MDDEMIKTNENKTDCKEESTDLNANEKRRRNLRDAYWLFPKLIDICKYYRNYCHNNIGNLDLTPSEIDVIMSLSEKPHLNTVKEISKNVHMSKSVISKAVELLRIKNYISVETCAADRRSVKIKLEEASKPVVDRLSLAAEEFIAKIGKGIDAGDLHIISKFVTYIYSNKEKMRINENI